MLPEILKYSLCDIIIHFSHHITPSAKYSWKEAGQPTNFYGSRQRCTLQYQKKQRAKRKGWSKWVDYFQLRHLRLWKLFAPEFSPEAFIERRASLSGPSEKTSFLGSGLIHDRRERQITTTVRYTVPREHLESGLKHGLILVSSGFLKQLTSVWTWLRVE